MDSYQHTSGELVSLDRRWPIPDQPMPSAEKVWTLAALMLQGVCFDPVRVVFGVDGRFMVQDGYNRIAASLLCNFSMIPTVVNENPWSVK